MPSSLSISHSQSSLNNPEFPGFQDYSNQEEMQQQTKKNLTVTSSVVNQPKRSLSNSSSSSSISSPSTSSSNKYDSESSMNSTLTSSPTKSRGSLSSSSLSKLSSRFKSQERLNGPTVQLRTKKPSSQPIPTIIISDYSWSSSYSSSDFSFPSTFTVDLSLLEIEPHTLPFKESSRLTPKCLPGCNPFLQQYDNGLLTVPSIDSRGKMVKATKPILKKLTTLKPSKASTDLSSLVSNVDVGNGRGRTMNNSGDSNLYVPWSKLTLPNLVRKIEKEDEVRDRSEANGTVVTLSDYDYDEDWDSIDGGKDWDLENEWSKQTVSFDLPSSSLSSSRSTSSKRRSLPPPLSIDTTLENRKDFKKFTVEEFSDEEDEDEDECSTPPDSPPSFSKHHGQGSSVSNSQSKDSNLKTSRTGFLNHSFSFSELPQRLSYAPGRLRTNNSGSWIMD